VTIPGLSEEDNRDVEARLKAVPEVDRAWVFGSRAKGTYRRGSDVDLAVAGPSLTFEAVTQLRYTLNEESLLPYHFDVVDRRTLASAELQDHIDRVGILVYQRT
jgi:predicted nucleotidyltransferase